MAEPPNKGTVSITGIVIPVEWTPEGAVQALALADFNEALYHLAPGMLTDRLAGLVQREVTVKGYLTERGGKKMIVVSEFSQTKTVGGKLLCLALAAAVGLVLTAGGAFAAEQASPAQAPKVMKQKTAKPKAVAKAKSTKKMKKAAKKSGAKKSPEVARLQQALAKAGFKVKADGIMGKHTRAALKKFQKKNGLKATGKPDQATKKALGLS